MSDRPSLFPACSGHTLIVNHANLDFAAQMEKNR